MKEDFDSIIERSIKERRIDLMTDAFESIADKYGVSIKTVYNRFNSMFGNKAKDLIKSALYPTKEVLVSKLLNSKDTGEFVESLDLPKTLTKGIYDKEWGVSTHQKAKTKVLLERLHIPYNPVREDNRSLWYSQLLGDGSYCSKRHAFRVIHGIKQAEYLKWKVSLINKAFPKTPSEVTTHLHSQGHEYVSYYSRNIGNIDIPYDKRHTVIDKLTPLGWLLWWLDDGGHYQNITIFSLDKDIVETAIGELKTYGIEARPYQYGFCMKGQEQDVLFYKNFIEPFLDVIPECMKYKVKI